jgi:adhesin/invasin
MSAVVNPALSWLSVTSSSTVPGTITVTANPNVLTTGTYSGNVTVTTNINGVSGSQNVPVTFTVGSGGGTSTSGIAPSQLNFQYQAGSGFSVAPGLIYVSGTGQFTTTVSLATGQNWLQATASGSIPGVVTVSIIPFGLAAGTYSGNVTVTANGITLGAVGVTLQVSTTPVLTVNPSTICFQCNNNTLSQSIFLGASDNSALTVTASTPTSWLAVTASGSTVSVTANPAGLAGGVYTGQVSITPLSSTIPATAVTVPVVLVVAGGTGTGGTLTLSPSAFTLSAASGGAAQTSTLSVTASVNTIYTATATSTNNFLSIAPSGTLTTGSNPTITVTANPAALANGTYTGNIALTANGITQNVPVTMVVGGTGGNTGNITTTPSEATGLERW